MTCLLHAKSAESDQPRFFAPVRKEIESMDSSTFELHSISYIDRSGFAESTPLNSLQWTQSDETCASILEVKFDDSDDQNLIWVGIDEVTNCPCRIDQESNSIVGFKPVQRKMGNALAMCVRRDAVLVNGFRALSFSVLSARDSLVLSPGVHTYVTQRIRPHVGPPLNMMIGQKCPFCRIPITEDTQVVSCRCGVVYHNETEESHADVDVSDRLNCFAKLRACLSCNRPVTLNESLVWDPSML